MEQSTFKSRTEAGKLLAEKLSKYKNQSNVIVYGLTRGGIPIAVEIAKELNTPLDIIITRKIGHPFSSEYTVGAVTEAGVFIANEDVVGAYFNSDMYQQEIQKQLQEAKNRREIFMGGREQLKATNKTAIIVDDGIVSGFTMKAAIATIRKQGPLKVIVATPVIMTDSIETFKKLADELVYVKSDYFLNIAVNYESFPSVDDKEVTDMLKAYVE